MRVVISGVNLIEGGTLKVFQDAIVAFSKLDDVELICLVHDASLFNEIDRCKVKYISFPNVKKNWLNRVFFEYIQCHFISKNIAPDIWLAMHDMTPYLYSGMKIKQYVYCHNPSPFYKATLADFFFNPKFFLFTLFYKYLYKINISANSAVICQQRWIGDFFKNQLKAPNVILARPNSSAEFQQLSSHKAKSANTIILFYPALPRTFKNFELILQAIQVLDKTKLNNKSLELVITIDGSESRYARWLYKKYLHVPGVKFVGRLTREQVSEYYQLADLVLFPSKLETWGLPIVEAKDYQKPIFLADLPYAHETLGYYDKAKFIDVSNYALLATYIEDFINGSLTYDNVVEDQHAEADFFSDWDSLAKALVR